jgi:iron-sulfur cluster repair protein YtfE (RIC family)
MLTQKEKNVVISKIWDRYMDELRSALPELPPLGQGKRKHHKQTQQHKQKINDFLDIILKIQIAEEKAVYNLFLQEKYKADAKIITKLLEEMEVLKTETNININNQPYNLITFYPPNQNLTVKTTTKIFNQE